MRRMMIMHDHATNMQPLADQWQKTDSSDLQPVPLKVLWIIFCKVYAAICLELPSTSRLNLKRKERDSMIRWHFHTFYIILFNDMRMICLLKSYLLQQPSCTCKEHSEAAKCEAALRWLWVLPLSAPQPEVALRSETGAPHTSGKGLLVRFFKTWVETKWLPGEDGNALRFEWQHE